VVDSAVQVRHESGDVIAALAEGAYSDDKEIELKDVVAERGKGRRNDQEITLFKSVGTAMQDIVAGGVVHEAARRDLRGTDIGEFLDLKRF
jgi:ornithine cyclodeaminase/alanine dehydrogenase-like protein (mu-crystallin family)